ncbi:MAG: nucleotidyl transferase AbiEii/AbiGii toxin family protein [bacterium]|nr:nucleotidyl transferase AbiEii/AbiGii toxin family protein [bacterium]
MADATGFLADRLEKTVRLLALADDIAAHPYLGGRLALTGGTALNVFVLPAPRLSFDLDYNYIGAPDRDTMKAERPTVEAALADVFADHRLRVKKRPNMMRDHAGGKWDLRYQDAFGGSESLSVDVGYVRRVPLWPTTYHDSHRLGRWQATAVPLFDIHEIAAGKLSALLTRAYARDLFDAALIPDLPCLDPAKLRTTFVTYGGGARQDWRAVCANPPKVAAPALGRQLRPALTRTDAQRTRPFSADHYLAELQAKATAAQQMVLPFTQPERAFLDTLLDRGRVEPQLLTTDQRLQDRITEEPWLQWKALNVRRHMVRQKRAVPPAVRGVHVRPCQDDNQGWEVVTTGPDGSPRQMSGPHPTANEAEAARDFMLRLLNGNPRLNILGSGPQRTGVSAEGPHTPPSRDGTPTVGIYTPDHDSRWYVQCRNPDGTIDTTSPPYPTYQEASNVLDQLGWLSTATADSPLGHRATAEPTSAACRCSQAGWRCGHTEALQLEGDPPDRGHGLSL